MVKTRILLAAAVVAAMGMAGCNTMKSMTVLKVGQSGDAKANQHHFAAARGHTVVEVSGTGPFVVNYVNPADDPRKAIASKSRAKTKA